MTSETDLQTGAALLAEWTQETHTPEDNRLDLIIQADALLPAVEALREARWGYLAAITGLDLGPEDGRLEVLYHFCSGSNVLTVRVRIPRDAARIPSIFTLVPSVSFYERELMEMFGVKVVNTPDPSRLFLPDDWPQGVFPLRKEFKFEDAQAGNKRFAS